MDAREPSSYEEAIATPDAETWLQAMKSEMDSIHQNHTWELVERPTGRKWLPCKWVFRYKYVSYSEKPKYKVRLVSKGFKQEHGVDYDEVFSPIVKMTTLSSYSGWWRPKTSTGRLHGDGGGISPRMSTEEKPPWLKTSIEDMVPEVRLLHLRA